ncbi:MAG TPA: tRNA (adenosine(37)-N6)-threonylcarbamoyltransferase complex ATPase subunit type 1 TsaE [Bacteroidota bacterium]
MNASYRTTSEEETSRVAGQFAGRLDRGDVVALYGDLGAGKTQFVKGICRTLEVRETVASPSFVILHRYEGRDSEGNELLIHHFDLYRVRSAEEIYDLGYEEFLFGSGICIVEWADRLHHLLPAHRYDIRLGLGSSENERTIQITRVHSDVASERDPL